MATLFFSILLALTTPIDVSNSHRVGSITEVIAHGGEAAEVPPIVWEVGTTGGFKHYVEAVKVARSGDLFLMADTEDEIVMAIHKDHFLYARRLKPGEKKP